MASKKESTTLPHKEAGLFKRMVKSYEQKQYKPGLKLAKQILSAPKCAEHGGKWMCFCRSEKKFVEDLRRNRVFRPETETLAMKGLILNCLGKKDEAYENVKRGLKNDVRSYLCWHVYGLLHRSDRKYEQAISAYLNALRIDEKNMQILRDLSTLQIHMRDLEGFKQTRFRMVSIKPTQPVNWISLAIANHMLGDLQLAYRTLEEYRSNSTPNSTSASSESGSGTPADLEYAEVILYQVELLLDMGQYEEALNHFGKHQSFVVDKMAALELKGQALKKLNRVGEAKTVYMEMLKRNPYNRDILQALLELEKFANETEKLNFIGKLRSEFPESRQAAMLPLFELTGDNFRQHFFEAAKTSFVKGIPAFFADIKPLYNIHNIGSRYNNSVDADNKIRIIGETMLSYYQQISSEAAKNPSSGGGDSTSVADSDVIEGRPRCIMRLWAALFLAQHFDKLEMYTEALRYADESIEIAPTLLEALCVKGRILKHLGRFDEAVSVIDAAQQLDTADRYLNYKCAKYLMRANRIRDAEKLMSNFPREGTKTEENQLEMQAYWYMFEKAKALFRLQLYGDALRICQHAARIFNDMIEDQFDFHLYCLRKFTVRSYLRMLQEADRIHANRFYLKFASLAVTIYLLLMDGKINPKRDNEIFDESLVIFSTPKTENSSENKENSPPPNGGESSSGVFKSFVDPSKAEVLERLKQEREALLIAKKVLAAEEKLAAEKKSSTENAKEDKNPKHNQQHNNKKDEKAKDDDEAVGNAPPVDYEPQELLSTKDPLEVAYKFIKPLLSLERIENVQTLRLAFEVCRRKKLVPAMLRLYRMLEQQKFVSSCPNTLLQLWQEFEQLRSQSAEQLAEPLRTTILDAKPADPSIFAVQVPPSSNNNNTHFSAVDEFAARTRNSVLNRTLSLLQQHMQPSAAAQPPLLRTNTTSRSSSTSSRTQSLSIAPPATGGGGGGGGGAGEPAASSSVVVNGGSSKLAAAPAAAGKGGATSPGQPSKQQQLYMSAAAAAAQKNNIVVEHQQPNGVL